MPRAHVGFAIGLLGVLTAILPGLAATNPADAPVAKPDKTLVLPGGGRPLDGEPIIKGFRNPIYLRCQRGHNNCFTVELTRDYSAGMKGREKIVPIRKGDDWGYPCCATKNTPFPDTPAADCSMVPDESVAFYVADTPFGFDWERDFGWPEPYQRGFFVGLHGDYAVWAHAGLQWAPTDPQTHLPTQSTMDFALGFGRGGRLAYLAAAEARVDCGRLSRQRDRGGARSCAAHPLPARHALRRERSGGSGGGGRANQGRL